MKTLIIIPALDEAATIADVLKKTKKCGWNNILVVDDFSQDNTSDIASKNGAEVISLPINLGAWGAIQTGMSYALEKGYSRVLTMDGDNQHKPEYISKLLTLLGDNDILDSNNVSHGNDMVIGSYLSRGSSSKQFIWPFLRKLSGLDIQDFTSGFRAYNKKAMQVLLTNESLLLDYQDIGVLLLCKKNNLKISEIKVKMDQRETGKSRIFKNSYMIIRYFLVTLFLIGTKRW